jgi:hypothetical protein
MLKDIEFLGYILSEHCCLFMPILYNMMDLTIAYQIEP